MAYSAVMTALLLWLVRLGVSLRVDEADEAQGLDVSQHREHLGA